MIVNSNICWKCSMPNNSDSVAMAASISPQTCPHVYLFKAHLLFACYLQMLANLSVQESINSSGWSHRIAQTSTINQLWKTGPEAESKTFYAINTSLKQA